LQVSTHVRVGESLHLQPFLSSEARTAAAAAGLSAADGPNAELFAVVVHQGHTVHSGHYYAYVGYILGEGVAKEEHFMRR
jgi:uncharacterized UBP type Zn finger protein